MCCAQRLCSCADCARVQTAVAVAQAAIARQARKADLFSLVMKDPWAFNSFSANNCRVEDPRVGVSGIYATRSAAPRLSCRWGSWESSRTCRRRWHGSVGSCVSIPTTARCSGCSMRSSPPSRQMASTRPQFRAYSCRWAAMSGASTWHGASTCTATHHHAPPLFCPD